VLRTNLSTRPFYNERAIHVLLALLAIVIAAIAVWEAAHIIMLSRFKTELTAAIGRDRDEANRRTREAADIRRGLNQKELATIAAAAREANDLIERRTFSWTELFNQLEATLPEDVMLTAVHPEFKDGATHVNMDIQGRRTEDIDRFFERLEATGAFHDVEWSAETVTEEGLHHMTMTAVYAPPGGGVRRTGASVPQKGAR
jgi:Tfp pilus assembly protein PilN